MILFLFTNSFQNTILWHHVPSAPIVLDLSLPPQVKRVPLQNKQPVLLPQQQMAPSQQLLQHQPHLRQIPHSQQLPLPLRNAETTRAAG